MEGKIFGIPLVIILLVLAIVAPISILETVNIRTNRQILDGVNTIKNVELVNSIPEVIATPTPFIPAQYEATTKPTKKPVATQSATRKTTEEENLIP